MLGELCVQTSHFFTGSSAAGTCAQATGSLFGWLVLLAFIRTVGRMLNNRVAGNDEVSCQRIVNVVNVANSKAVHVEPVHKERGRSLDHPNVHRSCYEKNGRIRNETRQVSTAEQQPYRPT